MQHGELLPISSLHDVTGYGQHNVRTNERKSFTFTSRSPRLRRLASHLIWTNPGSARAFRKHTTQLYNYVLTANIVLTNQIRPVGLIENSSLCYTRDLKLLSTFAELHRRLTYVAERPHDVQYR